MMDIWRSLASAVFGWRYVQLADHDGEATICRVKWRGGKPVADRVGFGIRVVGLLDNGGVANGHYVDSWSPYEPSAEKRWPKYEAAE